MTIATSSFDRVRRLVGRPAQRVHRAVRLLALAAAAGLFGQPASSQPSCPDGQFPDPTASSSGVCRELLTDRGFDAAAFTREAGDTVVVVPAERCHEQGVRDALRTVRRAGGGTVSLSACAVVDIAAPLVIPDRTILTGGGADPPPLIRKAGFAPTSLLTLHRVAHVAIRHLRLDGRHVSKLVVEAQYAANVLIEHAELRNGANNGVNFAYSQGFTVRYSTFSGHRLNGITSKECYTQYGDGLAACTSFLDERAGHDFAPGVRFSRNYALYGNAGSDNGDYCIAMHAREGEIAGNACRSNRRGVKLPDAQAVVVHRNLIAGNLDAGLHVYAPIAGLSVYGVVIAANRIVENGGYPIRIYGAEAALLDNAISANACSGHCPDDRPHDAVINGEQEYADATEVDADTEICPATDEHAILLGGSFGPIPPRISKDIAEGECLNALPGYIAFARVEAEPTIHGIAVSWIPAEHAPGAQYAVDVAFGDEPFIEVGTVGAEGSGPLEPVRHHVETASAGSHRVRVRRIRPGEPEVVSPVRVVERPRVHATGIGSLYPQPAHHAVSFEIRPSNGAVLGGEIVDVLGRRVRTIDDAQASPDGAGRLRIRVDDLAPGIYWVHFRLQGGDVVRPLVVSR